MQFKAREVKSALTRKGFKEENRDHHYYFLYYLGKKTQINTKISFGETDLDPRLSSFMARQIKLTSPKFTELVDCKLTGEDYLELLIKAGHIVPSPPPPEKNKSSR